MKKVDKDSLINVATIKQEIEEGRLDRKNDNEEKIHISLWLLIILKRSK